MTRTIFPNSRFGAGQQQCRSRESVMPYQTQCSKQLDIRQTQEIIRRSLFSCLVAQGFNSRKREQLTVRSSNRFTGIVGLTGLDAYFSTKSPVSG